MCNRGAEIGEVCKECQKFDHVRFLGCFGDLADKVLLALDGSALAQSAANSFSQLATSGFTPLGLWYWQTPTLPQLGLFLSVMQVPEAQ